MSWTQPSKDEQHLPRQDEEEEHEDELQVISPTGHEYTDAQTAAQTQEITVQDLEAGFDAHDENPAQAQLEGHPTPDRPAGRIVP